MLAFLGWIANDAGLKFPGEVFQVRRRLCVRSCICVTASP